MTSRRNWAVFDLETGFRLTEYATRTAAVLAWRRILEDQPGRKAGVRQRKFEKRPKA